MTINHISCPSETQCLVEEQDCGSWSASHVAGTVPGAGDTAARKPDVAKHTQNRQAGILTEEQTRNKKVIQAHLGDIVFGSRPLQ